MFRHPWPISNIYADGAVVNHWGVAFTVVNPGGGHPRYYKATLPDDASHTAMVNAGRVDDYVADAHADVTVAAAGKTYTSAALFDFVALGFVAGDLAAFSGCAQAGNNGTKRAAVVAQHVLTTVEACVDEAAGASVTIARVEADTGYIPDAMQHVGQANQADVGGTVYVKTARP